MSERFPMLTAFVEYSGTGRRTPVPGGPWPTEEAAFAAVVAYGIEWHGGWAELLARIDAYGFEGEPRPVPVPFRGPPATAPSYRPR